MPLSQLEHDLLARSFAVCKSLLNDVQPKLASLNEIYNSVGGVSSTLTQAELDELPVLSGLQKQTVDDALSALSVQILAGITNAFAAISQMAARTL